MRRIRYSRNTVGTGSEEWTHLKHFIANKIDIFSKDFDTNLEIYCDAVGFKELKQLLNKKILSGISTDTELKGLSELTDTLNEAERYKDTEIIYTELKYFNRQNNNKYKWLILNH
ncbi:MAG: hypothetical protein U9N32_09500, partial [Spirochaetota bacterium]|nr:hypothetical protein [Spirochaetota bacterium]